VSGVDVLTARLDSADIERDHQSISEHL
jgi:hypothetical protein